MKLPFFPLFFVANCLVFQSTRNNFVSFGKQQLRIIFSSFTTSKYEEDNIKLARLLADEEFDIQSEFCATAPRDSKFWKNFVSAYLKLRQCHYLIFDWRLIAINPYLRLAMIPFLNYIQFSVVKYKENDIIWGSKFYDKLIRKAFLRPRIIGNALMNEKVINLLSVEQLGDFSIYRTVLEDVTKFDSRLLLLGIKEENEVKKYEALLKNLEKSYHGHKSPWKDLLFGTIYLDLFEKVSDRHFSDIEAVISCIIASLLNLFKFSRLPYYIASKFGGILNLIGFTITKKLFRNQKIAIANISFLSKFESEERCLFDDLHLCLTSYKKFLFRRYDNTGTVQLSKAGNIDEFIKLLDCEWSIHLVPGPMLLQPLSFEGGIIHRVEHLLTLLSEKFEQVLERPSSENIPINAIGKYILSCLVFTGRVISSRVMRLLIQTYKGEHLNENIRDLFLFLIQHQFYGFVSKDILVNSSLTTFSSYVCLPVAYVVLSIIFLLKSLKFI